MAATSVDSALEALEKLQDDPMLTSPLKDQVLALQLEFRFLKMFFWCFTTWRNAEMGTSLSNITAELSRGGLRYSYVTTCIFAEGKDVAGVGVELSKLLEMVELCKQEIKSKCVALLGRSFEIDHSFRTRETVQFLDSILQNLKYVLDLKTNMIFRVKTQVRGLEEKVSFFRNLADFMVNKCSRHEELANFFTHIQVWANIVACLTILYWIDHSDERTPNVIEMYFRVPKGSKSARSSDTHLIGELVARFVEFFLENMGISRSDSVEVLREGMIFLITFLMDPPEEHAENGKLILTATDDSVSEATSLICSLYVQKMKGEIAKERDVLVFDFLEKVDTLKAEVRHFYVQIPKILLSNFPMTNAIGFIESLNEKLKGEADLIPFAKEQVLTVRGQLQSLLPFLPDMMELANKYEEMKDLWSEIINVAYHVEHVTDSCSRVKDRQIWYGIVCLSHVIKEIELIKLQVIKIKDRKIYNIRNVSEKLDFSSSVPVIMDQVVVGFKKEADTIIEQLIRGPARLDFVSIVGMPGQGKTTLAKKVYNDSSIQYHFHKSAWCCVSQVYSRRKLLLDILSSIIAIDIEIKGLSEEELAERLWKSLRHRRYLIVIDDIWDIKAWHDLKISFPDDKNGSRIMLTSRISNVALQVKPDCILHLLCSLSDDESWELFKIKVELTDDCPSDLLDVGKLIVKSCKGLPLAIVVIAGVLGRMREDMLDWWKQIAENLSLQLATGGCMDVLELSYMYLPDHLKPCFVYFGAFPQDKVTRARKLIKLWIAEGFVRRTNEESIENVAEKYLMDLVDRSLVLVTRRSSGGGVHTCYIHDLFHDLCLARAQEEHFFQLVHGCDGYDVSCASLNPIKYDQYRLGIYTDWEPFIESRPTGPRVRSLLYLGKTSWKMCYRDGIISLSNSFKYLRVLDLGSIFFGNYFPEAIETLVLLRYLEIAGKFTEVPSSIEKLQNLETLIVKSILSVVLPHSIWLMKNLRHLDVKEDTVLTWSYHEFQFSNIEILSCIRISTRGYIELLLRRLPRLRKLSCIFEDRLLYLGNDVKMRSQFQNSGLLGKLESLKVQHLEASGVHYKLQRFSFPKTLRKLTLSRFCLPWNAISAITLLPNLQILKLKENAFTGPRWDMEDDEKYSNLKFLELYHLDLKQWNASTDSFPCLEQLVLRHCYKLEGIPPNIGDVSTLKKIELSWCNKLATNSARRIIDEQQDMGNVDLEVIITHILN